MPLLDQSATALLSMMNEQKLSSVELVRECLAQIERHDGQVKAFLRVDSDRALAQAGAIDARRARGDAVGKLAGLPVAVKDLLCDSGELCTCASRMLANFRPPYDSTVVAQLKAADAVLLGRTNLDEFAMGGSGENSAFQVTRNPWNLACTPGGSSSGAAACVAARMVPLSIGSDTGGSIRQPAGLCGITGLKPTYGRVSRFGLVAFASSLDQVGPLTNSAEDAALLLEVLAGHDPRDTTSIDEPAVAYSQTVSQPLKNLKIGRVRAHFGPGIDPEVAGAVDKAFDVYRSLGATICDVELKYERYGIATYYIIAPSEASSNLARYDGVHYGYRTDEGSMLAELAAERKQLAAAKDEQGLEALDSPLLRMYRRTRSEGFGPEVKRRIMLGTYTLSAYYHDAYYVKALKVRRLIAQDYEAAFQKCDLIAGPVSPTAAFKIGEKNSDPLSMYLVDLYTVGANLAGIPGISIPCGFSSTNLPIGLQLQGPALAEDRLLRAAHMFQQATAWHRQDAPLQ